MRYSIQFLRPLIAIVLMLCGCTTRPPGISTTTPSASSNTLHLKFHAAILMPDLAPAIYSFQEARGKRGSAREALSEAAEIAVGGPALGIIVPGIILGESINCVQNEGQFVVATAFAGAAGGAAVVGAGVIAPAVVAKGVIRSWKTVSPEELTQRQQDLEHAFQRCASQELFHQLLLAQAEQKSPGRLMSIEGADKSQTTPSSIDAHFEARIDELRLERNRADEGSYFLRIKARARLLRKSDGSLLYEQSVEYRSGRALFIDWTDHGALEGVAQTGYRALAEYFTTLIL